MCWQFYKASGGKTWQLALPRRTCIRMKYFWSSLFLDSYISAFLPYSKVPIPFPYWSLLWFIYVSFPLKTLLISLAICTSSPWIFFFFQGTELRPSGNHLLWPEQVPPTGNTGQWILSAACAGLGGTVFRKKVVRERTAHGASETRVDLRNYVAEATLFGLLCQIAQDAQAWEVQRPWNAGKLQCHPFMTCSHRPSGSTLCSNTCQKTLTWSHPLPF